MISMPQLLRRPSVPAAVHAAHNALHRSAMVAAEAAAYSASIDARHLTEQEPDMTTMLNLSPTATRASLIALAAVVTLSVLSALAQIANEQVQDVRLAQSPAVTQSAAADQVVVIVGKRIPRA